MKLDYIRKNWATPNKDVDSQIALWDSQANDPTYNYTPTFEDNVFLQFLEKNGMLDKGYSAIDIGCGAGNYPLAIAPKVKKITGLDFSGKMLERGKAEAKKRKIKNVEFIQADWGALDTVKEKMTKKFDLVYTHTSPAVSDLDTFEKFISISKKYCVICNPTKMVEPVLEGAKKAAGIKENEGSCDSSMAFILDILLDRGKQPRFEYEKQVWPMNQPYEQACVYYLGRIAMGKKLSDAKEKKVRDYLKSVSKKGMVSDSIDATVTTIWWTV